MSKKKIIVYFVILLCFTGAVFIINSLSGNPISKRNTQKQYLQYFEKTYHQKFVVYNSQYNPKIPAYIFEIGPENNKKIRFDTALYSMGISDEYGGKLASAKLAKEIAKLLDLNYGYLNPEITAAEDPLTGYGGETPDYFETDPAARIKKNHYVVYITWIDSGNNESEAEKVFSGMTKVIEKELPFKTPNLTVNIDVKGGKPREEKIFSDRVFLFPTTK